ncbi:thiolase family protein [Candidatus Entotheonella palauensis]|uniref:thiolase family protein n=1 Tax=Candidatus Entotheonella palauensis TaxID=93172 RepID=UPI0015C4E497|nr:thiolase family protein [Candidatus Entotheonella palauensis]
MREVVMAGAGLRRYGVFPDKNYVDMGVEAIRGALQDAGCEWPDIDAVYCGTVRLGMSAGHHICLKMGTTGLAITNVENASASGSSAFREAYLSVAAGEHEVVLALGVDKLVERPEQFLQEDADGRANEDRKLPIYKFAEMAQYYMDTHGVTRDQLAQVSVKSHYNASLNPYAHFQRAVTLEQIHQARMVADPLTVLHCCPWDEGAAAVMVCSREAAKRFNMRTQTPVIAASVLQSTPSEEENILFSADLTQRTAQRAYERAGCGPEDLQLVEMHDAFTIEELVYYEALGLTPKGEGARLIQEAQTEIHGRIPVNTSGGLISMGHPLGPTGLGHIAEILWQMRGQAGARQIPRDVNVALAHMVGAGGVCIVHIFRQ